MDKREQWFSTAVGLPMDQDGSYGLQCKDVADNYCMALFGNWKDTIRPGNGKDVFNNANPQYFDKIANNTLLPDQIPQRGDIINWTASPTVPEGHVAVVESADQAGVNVIMQDGYLQVPAFRARLGYENNGASVIGWLRPKIGDTMDKEDVINAYLSVEHRRPVSQGGDVTEAELDNWVGHKFKEFATVAMAGGLWLTQNHYITYFSQVAAQKDALERLVDRGALKKIYDAIGKIL